MLSLGASINMYMFYGGTNYGYTAGKYSSIVKLHIELLFMEILQLYSNAVKYFTYANFTIKRHGEVLRAITDESF